MRTLLKVEPSEEMINAGLSTLRRMMRRDSMLEDFQANTLRAIVREIFIAMQREQS